MGLACFFELRKNVRDTILFLVEFTVYENGFAPRYDLPPSAVLVPSF